MTSSTSASRLLAVDVGNTSTHFTYCVGEGFTRPFRVGTACLSKNLLRAIKKNIPLKDIRERSFEVAISSVVPTAGSYIQKTLKKSWGLKVYLIGKDIPIPIRNRYRDPKQVGVDRLLCALAAHHEHSRNLVIIDFGTAITFDAVSKTGVYLGGCIAPGVEISLEALFQKTALLPKIRLKHPKRLIGRDTVESIRSGCAFGIGGLCDGIVRQMEARYRARRYVIATGGYASFMSKYCTRFDRIEPLLIMKGIRLAYLSYQKRGVTA